MVSGPQMGFGQSAYLPTSRISWQFANCEPAVQVGTILPYMCLRSWPNFPTCLPTYLEKYGGRDPLTYPTLGDIRNLAAFRPALRKNTNLREREILSIRCTYGHSPLKCELNATKVQVTTRPSCLFSHRVWARWPMFRTIDRLRRASDVRVCVPECGGVDGLIL